MPFTDPEVGRAYLKTWHLKNKERRNLAAKKLYQKTSEQAKGHYLKNHFGISLDDYLGMHARQGGVCAICFRPETRLHKGRARALAVDHDHKTKKVRSLLCGACNIALGLLEEDPVRLHAMLKYLAEHNGKVD